MKEELHCAVSECKDPVCYVLVDACIEDNYSINRNEMACFPLCMEHDAEFHSLQDKFMFKDNDDISKKLKITKISRIRIFFLTHFSSQHKSEV